jgi:predicted Zn-dependent peptidase
MVKKINFIYNDDGLFVLQVHVPSGSIYEHKSKRNIKGISHLLEHMLFKHTENYTGKELLEAFTKLGGYYNASTDKDETIYYVRTLCENYELATNLIYDIVQKPVFKANELVQERKVALEEMASSKDDLEDTIYESGNTTFLCPKNVYSSPVIGKKTHLETMNIKELERYYKERYSKYIVLVNCDKKYKNKVKELLYKKFRQTKHVSLEDKDLAHLSKCVYPIAHQRVRIAVSDTHQYNTQLIFRGFKYSNISNNVQLKFVKYFLTGAGLYSLLYYELREKRGLVYNVTMSCERYRYLGLVKISFGTSNKDTIGIIKVVIKMINEIIQHGLTKEQLQFFKESYVNNIKYKFIDQESRSEWHGENIFYGCKLSEQKYIDMVMSINNDDIRKICQKVFNLKEMGFMTMGPYDKPKDIKNNILLLMV